MLYKHTCTICKNIFLSKMRGQNICSKACRRTIKKVKKYRKCIVCGWDATIEVHHEGGKEYDFCPNHHSLLTRGKQNLEEVLKGIIYSSKVIKISMGTLLYQKIKESNMTIFNYKDIMKLTGWRYERVKKHILNLIKLNKIKYNMKTPGGKNKPCLFRII